MEAVKLEEQMNKVCGAIPVTLIDDFDFMVNYFKPSLCPYSTINKLGEVRCTCKSSECPHMYCISNENCSYKGSIKEEFMKDASQVEDYKRLLNKFLNITIISHSKTINELMRTPTGLKELTMMCYAPYLYGVQHQAINFLKLRIINLYVRSARTKGLKVAIRDLIRRRKEDYEPDTSDIEEILEHGEDLVKEATGQQEEDKVLNREAAQAYSKIMTPVEEIKPVEQVIKITLHEPVNLDINKIAEALKGVVKLVTTNNFDIEVE